MVLDVALGGQIIIVDDGSKDHTVRVANEYVKKYKPDIIRVIKLGKNLGKGAAVRKVSNITIDFQLFSCMRFASTVLLSFKRKRSPHLRFKVVLECLVNLTKDHLKCRACSVLGVSFY